MMGPSRAYRPTHSYEPRRKEPPAKTMQAPPMSPGEVLAERPSIGFMPSYGSQNAYFAKMHGGEKQPQQSVFSYMHELREAPDEEIIVAPHVRIPKPDFITPPPRPVFVLEEIMIPGPNDEEREFSKGQRVERSFWQGRSTWQKAIIIVYAIGVVVLGLLLMPEVVGEERWKAWWDPVFKPTGYGVEAIGAGVGVGIPTMAVLWAIFGKKNG